MTAQTAPANEQTVIRMQRTIPASPQQVYRAWMHPDQVVRWMNPGYLRTTRAEIDPRVGGHYRIWQSGPDGEGGGFDAEILELEPNRRVVFKWFFVGPDRTSGPRYDSILTVTFNEAQGGGTALTLIHERLESLAAALPEVAAQVEAGWADVLDKLPSAID